MATTYFALTPTAGDPAPGTVLTGDLTLAATPRGACADHDPYDIVVLRRFALVRLGPAWAVEEVLPLADALGPQGELLLTVAAEAKRVLAGNGAVAQVYADAVNADLHTWDTGRYVEAAGEALAAAGAGNRWEHMMGCEYGSELLALAARDLIGAPGWTQEAYDALTSPWRKAIGRPVHPDDVVSSRAWLAP